MAIHIAERDREGIAILDVRGRMVHGPETEEFRSRTRSLVESGTRNLILHMLAVEHIDSTGLGELVALAQVLERNSGTVKLVELNQKHVELLVITKLSTVFEVFTDEQDAVNSFFPERRISSFDLLTFVQEIKQDGEEKPA